MTESLRMPRMFLAVLIAMWSATGCNTDPASARPDIAAIPAEEHYGRAVKSLVYEFRAKVRKRGVAAAQQELPILLENFDGWEKQALGTHRDTYQQIVDKAKEMEAAFGSSPSRDAIVKLADEMGTLADSLPGTADPNPEVE